MKVGILGFLSIFIFSTLQADIITSPTFDKDGSVISVSVMIDTVNVIITNQEIDLSLKINGKFNNPGAIKSLVKTKYNLLLQQFSQEATSQTIYTDNLNLWKSKLDFIIIDTDVR